MNIDLTTRLVKSMAPYPRKRGRYSASELYFIISGKTTPDSWLNQKEKKVEDIFKMWDGSSIHHSIQEILSRGYKEQKREWSDFGITIVAKADYLPGPDDNVLNSDEVWEFKSSNNLMEVAKPWHEHQTKMYCSLFGKDNGKIFQPIRGKKSIKLKLIGEVTRDDEWFLEQAHKLLEFHERVEKLWDKKLDK